MPSPNRSPARRGTQRWGVLRGGSVRPRRGWRGGARSDRLRGAARRGRSPGEDGPRRRRSCVPPRGLCGRSRARCPSGGPGSRRRRFRRERGPASPGPRHRPGRPRRDRPTAGRRCGRVADHDTNVVAAIEQTRNESAADVACCAGDEDLHLQTSPGCTGQYTLAPGPCGRCWRTTCSGPCRRPAAPGPTAGRGGRAPRRSRSPSWDRDRRGRSGC